MPTPSDSTDQLPLLEPRFERQAHTTCPPDEDRPGQWRVEVLDRLGRTGLDIAPDVATPQQEETPPMRPESPGPMDTTNDSVENKAPEKTTAMEPAPPSPPLPDASPSSSHVDDKEAEQIHPGLATSSALDLQYSIRYGIDSTRVSRAPEPAQRCQR